jgi:hypothetical protein
MSGTAGHRLNVMAVLQTGRLQYEAVLLAASLARVASPGVRLWLAEPQPGPLWPEDPRVSDPALRALLAELGATFLPFESRHFGAAYPHGNKIEALAALPEGEPFLFLDTDTLMLGDPAEVPFDFDRPAASLRVEGTWPVVPLYGPGYAQIWGALYARFGLDLETSLDRRWPEGHWRRHLYFNAGFFFHRCPRVFGARFLEIARSIRDDPPEELACQSLDPWLDQVALPLVIHGLGGGRDALAPGWMDGSHSCHWRALPLLYAREAEPVVALLEEIAGRGRVRRILREYEPFRRMIHQGKGRRLRADFAAEGLPATEARLRRILRNRKLWMR